MDWKRMIKIPKILSKFKMYRLLIVLIQFLYLSRFLHCLLIDNRKLTILDVDMDDLYTAVIDKYDLYGC